MLVAVCGYLLVLRWQQHRSERFNEAWAAYLSSGLPGAFEDVAAQYASIPGLPQQALRSAADTLLKQPAVVDYFIKYVNREGNEKAPDEVVKRLQETLSTLKEVASQPTLGAEEVETIHSSTGAVLTML